MAEHTAEWIRLTERKTVPESAAPTADPAVPEKLAQVGPVYGPPKGGRGNEGGIRAASRELGITKAPDHARHRAGIINMTIPSPGGPQSMICLPLSRLNFWLATIQTNKVPVAIRAGGRHGRYDHTPVLEDRHGQAPAVSAIRAGGTKPEDKSQDPGNACCSTGRNGDSNSVNCCPICCPVFVRRKKHARNFALSL